MAPGSWRTVSIPLAKLSNHAPITLPVHVIHGRRDGPTLFVCAGIHGDEVLGVEIIRRLIGLPAVHKIRGTVLFTPIVNVYGFISHSRYLPDRRDLNRSFPGNPDGSMASQLAHVFMTEIVARSNYGIDLHTGAIHRPNLPQIRGHLDVPGVRDLARAFEAPIILDARIRKGSVRQAAHAVGVEVLLYEAGEALRFDETAIRIGVKGVLGVMRHLGMVSSTRSRPTRKKSPVFARSSHWLRATAAGIFRSFRDLGEVVEKGDAIGVISDPFGETVVELQTRTPGVIIGRTKLPVVNKGDALVHIARVYNLEEAEETVGSHEASVEDDPMFDDDEIV